MKEARDDRTEHKVGSEGLYTVLVEQSYFMLQKKKKKRKKGNKYHIHYFCDKG
jgi:hypothetical protein